MNPRLHRRLREDQGPAGSVYRWVMKQGPMSLLLTLVGMVSFTVAAFVVTTALGWLVIGACAWLLDYQTRETL